MFLQELLKIKNMQSYHYSEHQPITSVQQDAMNQNAIIGNTLLGLVGILVFSGLILGAVLHKRRRSYRASALQQQIELLERMWQLPSKH
jgi:hypothetical protein